MFSLSLLVERDSILAISVLWRWSVSLPYVMNSHTHTKEKKYSLYKLLLLTDSAICEIILLLCAIVWCLLSFCYLCVCVFQVEWIQQQVVKRRIKRDYKQSPPLSLSSSAHSSPFQNNIFYNDAKWSSMWYIVSTLYTLTRHPLRLCVYYTNTRISQLRRQIKPPPTSDLCCAHLFFSQDCVLFFAHIYPVCGSKVSLGHATVLITAGSVPLRDLCVFYWMKE